jgi:GrpB-like predicted nucleotidyltransferase (UPF0157 family)
MNIDEKQYLIHYEKVYISNYDTNWEIQFINEKKLLQSCFPDVPIEHFGSTSVKGIVAKPIIDIMLGVLLYPPSDDMIKKLEELGYIHLGEADKTNGRTSFRKRNTVNYNLYIMKYLGKLWNNNILFREYLREHQDVAMEYSKIKQNAIDKGMDIIDTYYDEKREFISNIIKKIPNYE